MESTGYLVVHFRLDLFVSEAIFLHVNDDCRSDDALVDDSIASPIGLAAHTTIGKSQQLLPNGFELGGVGVDQGVDKRVVEFVNEGRGIVQPILERLARLFVDIISADGEDLFGQTRQLPPPLVKPMTTRNCSVGAVP